MQDEHHSGRRSAPKDMPTAVPKATRPMAARTEPKQEVPQQRPIDEQAPAQPPSKIKWILLKVATVLLIVVALGFAYIFLLLGEPDADVAATTDNTGSEKITAPIQALEVRGDGDLSALALSFGKPILTMPQGAALDAATLYDTAFEGGYARCVTMTYQLSGGMKMTLYSIRPETAVTLLGGERYTQRMGSRYALAGLDAQYLSSASGATILASGEGACYAMKCPSGAVDQIEELIRYCQLMQPAQ